MYLVGDLGHNCSSLACEGGRHGICNRALGQWSRRRVVCKDLDEVLVAEDEKREQRRQLLAAEANSASVTAAGGGDSSKFVNDEQVVAAVVVPAVPRDMKNSQHRTSARERYSAFLRGPALASGGWTIDQLVQSCKPSAVDAAQHDAWVASLSSPVQAPALLQYLRSVYGPGVNRAAVTDSALSHLRFFWNTVPGRETVNVTWVAAHCAILGAERPGTLFAPIDDAQHSFSLLTRPMVERCEAKASCAALDRCLDVPMRPLRRDDRPVSAHEARALVASGMRRCLASSLEAFGNFSFTPTYTAGLSSALRTRFVVGSEGYPRPNYTFPGFFLRSRSAKIATSASSVTSSSISSSTAATEAAAAARMTAAMIKAAAENSSSLLHGVPPRSWVEVMRIDRIDDKRENETADLATLGQVWFWHAPGSGVWWNTGKTLVIDDARNIITSLDGALSERACASPFSIRDWWMQRDAAFNGRTCATTRQLGYETMQLLDSFCGFTHEFVDCRGADREDANRTWSLACPPPYVPLMRGLPEPRHAPALAALRGPASLCSCSTTHSFINCAGNMEALHLL